MADYPLKNRGCGIIYCRTRGLTEEVARVLSQKGLHTIPYHAGLKDKERLKVQEDWTCGKYRVISATVSFGMGVDKTSVRFVVHWGIPNSIPAYYQESGRAGRDGNLAYCRIYHSKTARKSLEFVLRQEHSQARNKEKEAQAKSAYKAFERMVEYCESARCRHWSFTKFFGDDKPTCEDKCDVCLDEKKVEQILDQFHSHQNYTKFHLTDAGANSYNDSFTSASDLYGGGRYGSSRELDEYRYDDNDQDSNERKDTDLINEIKKQFALRKNSEQSVSDTEFTNSIVIAAESTKSKVNGLTIQAREDFAKFIKDLLTKNKNMCIICDAPNTNLNGKVIEKIALDMEYKAFSSSTYVNSYRRKLAQLFDAIKKNTKTLTLHTSLKNYKGNVEDNRLSSLIKNIESSKEDNSPFVKASTLIKQNSEKDSDQNEEMSDDDSDNYKETKEANENKEDSCKRKMINKTNKLTYDSNRASHSQTVSTNSDSYKLEEIDEKTFTLETQNTCNEVNENLSSPDQSQTLKRKYDILFGNSPSEQLGIKKKLKTCEEISSNTEDQLAEQNSSTETCIYSNNVSNEKQTVLSQKNSERFEMKKEFTDIVVKYLMPYYKRRKIESKDAFKFLARKIVHKLLPERVKYGRDEDIKTYIKNLYKQGILKKNAIEIEIMDL